jgi:hypothetical protein
MGKLLVLLVFSLAFLTFAGRASADGMVHVSDPDMWPGWRLYGESKQFAVINYENGRENLILAVDVKDLNASQAVWIFPVPAKPEGTNIGIVADFPRLVGYDIRERVQNTISGGFSLMSLSQVYPAPLFLLTTFGAGYAGGLRGDLQVDDLGGIEIHEHIESMGITTELVTAKNGSSLYGYLVGKGFQLPSESSNVIDEYVGKDYSFIISWISDVQSFRQAQGSSIYGPRYATNTLGVYVSFPSDRIYFPLRPTSVYGNQQIPIAIYVMGHVTPQVYSQIAWNTETKYFVQSEYAVPGSLSAFFNERTRITGLEYTKIDIKAPSGNFAQDLWINDQSPSWIKYTSSISTYFWVWVVFFFVLSSCLASLISGMVILRKYRPSKLRLAFLGLFNLLTIIGFTIAANKIGIGKPMKTKKLSNQNQVAWKSVKIFLGIPVMALLILLVIAFALDSAGWYILSMLSMVLAPLILFCPFLLIALVMIWSYQRSEEVTAYAFVFSILFLVFVTVFRIAFLSFFY